MRVLVTRPKEDAESLADALTELGCDVILEPLFTVEYDDTAKLDLADVQALLLTSANGARALARREVSEDLPVYAVGDATAMAAREAGFKQVHSADGGVANLGELVKDQIDDKTGVLLHVAGSDLAGDLGGDLESAGYTYRRAVLYKAEAVKGLSAATIAALKEGSIDSVLLFSPRAAEACIDLFRKARLVRAARDLEALCLSSAVAEAASAVSWKDLRVAPRPNQESLLSLVSSSDDTAGQDPVEQSELPNRQSSQARVATNQPAASRSGFSRFLVYTAAIVVVAGVVAALSPLWIEQVRIVFPGFGEDETTRQEVTALADRVAELEKASKGEIIPDLEALIAERNRLKVQLNDTLSRLSSIEGSVNTIQRMVGALNAELTPAEAEGVLRRLSDRIDVLEKTASGPVAATSEAVSKLSQQIAELAAQVPEQNAGSAQNRSALLALGQLREAVQSGRGFTSEVAALRQVADVKFLNGETAARLAELAEAGVPTPETLKASFDEAAGQIVRAGVLPAEGGWVDRTIARLTSPIKWRRTNQLEGEGVEAIVARSEVRVKAGNFAGAVDELKTLEGPAREAAAVWIASAESYIELKSVLAALHASAISRLSATGR